MLNLRSVFLPAIMGGWLIVLQLTTAEVVRADDDTEKDKTAEKEKKKDVRMPFLTVGLQAGVAYYGDMKFSAKDDNGDETTLNISGRPSALVKLHINLLGSGLGIEVNPLFAYEVPGDDGLEKFAALGIQLGLAYRFQIRRFYPKIGIGGHVAYLGGGDIDRGLEAYGRIPVGFTIYFARFLAFDLEVAYLIGATGLKTDGLDEFDKVAHWDTTSGLEAIIGLRFP